MDTSGGSKGDGMLKRFTESMTSRAAGPVATAVAVGLAVTLALSSSAWQARRLALETRIAELTQQSERSQSLLKAQLTACHAAAGGDQRLTRAALTRDADPQRLLDGPEGIDACARMESADQAVLSNLK
jgi:hypothetical protein